MSQIGFQNGVFDVSFFVLWKNFAQNCAQINSTILTPTLSEFWNWRTLMTIFVFFIYNLYSRFRSKSFFDSLVLWIKFKLIVLEKWIFESCRGFLCNEIIYGLNLWMNEEIKTRAFDIWLTLVIFCNMLPEKNTQENYSS